jgi:plasmid stabilization system protein ParE
VKVVWTDEASQDLAKVVLEAEYWSPRYARDLRERLLARGRQLERFPLSGHRSRRHGAVGIRELLERPWRVVYLPLDDRVVVLRILHTSSED